MSSCQLTLIFFRGVGAAEAPPECTRTKAPQNDTEPPEDLHQLSKETDWALGSGLFRRGEKGGFWTVNVRFNVLHIHNIYI